MKAHELSLKYNIDTYLKFKKFESNILPNKNKYPLTNNALQIIASNYFDSFFNPTTAFYPLAKPTLQYNKKHVSDILLNLNFNLFISINTYLLKILLIIFFKNKFFVVKFPYFDIRAKKTDKEDLSIEINIFSLRKRFNFTKNNIYSKTLKRLASSTISPLTVILLKSLYIPIKANLNNIHYLSKLNPIFLNLLETSFKHDLKVNTKFISFLNIKKFKHNGWYSIKGSILFKALSNLQIKSSVIAHGHVGQASMSFYYPIKSTTFLTLTEEEANRIRGLQEISNETKKRIDYLISSKDIEKKSLNDPFLNDPLNIIIGLTTPDILQVEKIKIKYEYLIKSLQEMKFKVFYRPHHHSQISELNILSLKKSIPCYKDPLSFLDKEKTIILGSCTTLLLDAFNLNIKSYEITDFAHNISGIIKSLPSYSIERFLALARKHKIR